MSTAKKNLWIAARSRSDRLLVGLAVCDCVESALIYTTDAAHYAACAGPSRREALARFADLVRARVPRPEIS